MSRIHEISFKRGPNNNTKYNSLEERNITIMINSLMTTIEYQHLIYEECGTAIAEAMSGTLKEYFRILATTGVVMTFSSLGFVLWTIEYVRVKTLRSLFGIGGATSTMMVAGFFSN